MSETTTPRPISRLRQHMLDELAIREFGDKTRDDYIPARQDLHDLHRPSTGLEPAQHRRRSILAQTEDLEEGPKGTRAVTRPR